MGGSIGLGAAGSIVAAFGYSAAFLTLAAVAVIALLVMVVAMSETRPTPGKLDQPLLGVTLKSISQPLCFRPGPALKRAALARIESAGSDLTCWLCGGQRECLSHFRRICAIV